MVAAVSSGLIRATFNLHHIILRHQQGIQLTNHLVSRHHMVPSHLLIAGQAVSRLQPVPQLKHRMRNISLSTAILQKVNTTSRMACQTAEDHHNPCDTLTHHLKMLPMGRSHLQASK
jgi:hypothetical protein